MGKLSRTKGVEFEQRIARDLRKVFPLAEVHRSSQADRPYNGDVVIEGNAPDLARRLWLELQDARHPAPLDKLAQAERDVRHDARWRVPVVVWHQLAKKAIHVTLRLDALVTVTQRAPVVGDLAGMPVTIDWDQFLDVLRAIAAPAKEAA